MFFVLSKIYRHLKFPVGSIEYISIVGIVVGFVFIVVWLASAIPAFVSGRNELSSAIISTPIRVIRPTTTPNIAAQVTHTSRPRSITATPPKNPGCTQAQYVSLVHVGKTMCVYGIINGIGEDNTAQYINFRDTDFQLITYDASVKIPLKSGDCLQVEGEIKKLGSHPVMIFNVGDTYWNCE